MVELVLEAGANVNTTLEHGEYRNAMVAAKEEGNGEMIEILRKHGATE